ncbi:MAG: hypothetical protein HY062_16170 [Bacteroidetes bacterium]|nr:hypothetical protein [Bacteroidota bacterium]
METKKNIGVWMDHSVAHIITPGNNNELIHTIYSKFTHQEKEQSLSKSENLMHNKEQHLQIQYYNTIKDVLKNYTNIILFGPGTAKSELLNLIKIDHHFENIKTDAIQADKMTEKQQEAFVNNHFHLQ